MLEKQIDPKSVGLSSRDSVIQIDMNHYALFIDRKSRIIMADAPRLLEKVETLCQFFQEAKISLKTTAPICGKTRAFLESHHIDII
ncbi:hypothetical protein ACFL4L_01085 [bacterium]